MLPPLLEAGARPDLAGESNKLNPDRVKDYDDRPAPTTWRASASRKMHSGLPGDSDSCMASQFDDVPARERFIDIQLEAQRLTKIMRFCGIRAVGGGRRH